MIGSILSTPRGHREVLAAALALAAAFALGGCAAAPQGEAEQAEQQEADVEVAFEGNEDFAGFRLRRQIEDLLIDFARDPQRESAIFDAASDLTDHLQSSGYPDADVGYRIEREPDLRVVFTVREGPAVTIDKLELAGNEAIPTDDLLPLWSRVQSGLLGLGDPYFVEADLRAFAVAIRNRYVDSGYLDARTEGPIIERAPGATTASVRLVIDEGERYALRALDVAEELAAVQRPAGASELIGRPFDPLQLQTLRTKYRKSLEDAGYPDPRIRLALDIDREGRAVTARIEGDPGHRSRVVAVRVEGHDRTAESRIRAELEFAVGEWYSGSKVEESLRSLYLSGLFTRVRVDKKEVAPGELELVVVLEEAEAREFSVLVGYGSYEQARAGVFFTDRNLFGIGQSFRVGSRISMKGYGVDGTWTEPDLFADVSLSVTGFFREREEPAFTDVSTGVSTALSRRLLPNTQARLGYSFENRDGSDIDPSLRTFVDNEFLVGKVFTELSHDNRDSRLYPTRGNRESVRLEHATRGLGGDIEFQRLTAQASLHVPLSTRKAATGDPGWTLNFAAHAGLIWRGDNEPLPVQERFYNGGESTVRSFERSELGPRTLRGTPAGGEYRNVFNAELRFPILGPLKGALFADAGNVGRDVDDYGLSNLRYALGGGVRLALPIGPVRFDAGFNPDTAPGERDYTLHLSVGYPF